MTLTEKIKFLHENVGEICQTGKEIVKLVGITPEGFYIVRDICGEEKVVAGDLERVAAHGLTIRCLKDVIG